MTDHVSRAENVHHADHVEHADRATIVGTVQMMEVRTDDQAAGIRRLQAIRDIAGFVVVIVAFLVTFFVILNRTNQTNFNARLLQEASGHLTCSGRYQDVVDAASTETLITIGELVVVITQIPPGTEREQAVTNKIQELAKANEASRLAVNAKIQYNNADQPLPCPLNSPAQTPPPTTTP